MRPCLGTGLRKSLRTYGFSILAPPSVLARTFDGKDQDLQKVELGTKEGSDPSSRFLAGSCRIQLGIVANLSHLSPHTVWMETWGRRLVSSREAWGYIARPVLGGTVIGPLYFLIE